MKTPIKEVEKKILNNLKCPKCGGKIFKNGDDDISCFTCGWAGGEFITEGMSRGPGRKREGIYTKCLDCGDDIYVRPHRIETDKDDKEYRCRKCASRQAATQPRPNRGGRPPGAKDGKKRKIRVPSHGDTRRILTDDDLPPITKQEFETALEKVSNPVKRTLPPQPSPEPVSSPPASERPKRGPNKKNVYFDKNRHAILADRLSLGHADAMRKWRITEGAWGNMAKRWAKDGTVVEDLRRLAPQIDNIKKSKEPWLEITTELIGDWQTDLANLIDQSDQLENEIWEIEARIGIALELIEAYKKKYPIKAVNVTE